MPFIDSWWRKYKVRRTRTTTHDEKKHSFVAMMRENSTVHWMRADVKQKSNESQASNKSQAFQKDNNVFLKFRKHYCLFCCSPLFAVFLLDVWLIQLKRASDRLHAKAIKREFAAYMCVRCNKNVWINLIALDHARWRRFQMWWR